ncbi:MAG: YggS family pyridoxal phosphate-dependent enzyme [Clostridiaceae bacterium]|nr:YggS family pyridoxal phosphate-dependent enzyme [Clostridiaceae bacterium]
MAINPYDPVMKAALAERIRHVRENIAAAALAAGRNPSEITLIGVSKFFPSEAALAAVQCGLTDLGENRVQEMLGKIDDLAAAGQKTNWHLIGTLQKNKVRLIIGRTYLIHSVDSESLLEEIGRRSAAQGLITDVLLQVNTAGEETKHGFEPEELARAAELALSVSGIRLRGLMTMAPLLADPEDTLPVFDRTRSFYDKLADSLKGSAEIDCLSMGMSHDYIQAIRCGATHVRIGSAIFGPRPAAPENL